MTETANNRKMTTEEVVARFNELAQQEKWFEIQDELFADHARSIDPEDSPYFGYAEGRAAIRQKGLDWIAKVEEVHGAHTTQPLVCGNHFTVGRSFDLTVKDFGRVKIEEIMLYKVEAGQIVSEQFFY
jgi:hypothetical protein